MLRFCLLGLLTCMLSVASNANAAPPPNLGKQGGTSSPPKQPASNSSAPKISNRRQGTLPPSISNALRPRPNSPRNSSGTPINGMIRDSKKSSTTTIGNRQNSVPADADLSPEHLALQKLTEMPPTEESDSTSLDFSPTSLNEASDLPLANNDASGKPKIAARLQSQLNSARPIPPQGKVAEQSPIGKSVNVTRNSTKSTPTFDKDSFNNPNKLKQALDGKSLKLGVFHVFPGNEKPYSFRKEVTRVVEMVDGTEKVYEVTRATPFQQGWKIHVSVDPNDIGDIAAPAANKLMELGASFKIWDLDDYSKAIVETPHQAGKFITVYPISKENAIDLVRELRGALSTAQTKNKATVVENDVKPYADSPIYLRYGQFSKEGKRGKPPANITYSDELMLSSADDEKLRQDKNGCPDWKIEERDNILSELKTLDSPLPALPPPPPPSRQ